MTEPNMPPYPGPPPGPPRTAPKKPSSRTAWIIGGVVVALFAMFWVIGTLNKDDDQADADAAPAASTSSSSSSSAAPVPTTAAVPPPVAPTTAAAAACYPSRPIADPELAAFAGGLSLPPGVQVVTGRVSTQSSKPGQVGVALDLCVPGSTDAETLRPIATSIAAALKPTALGQRTFALYVADMSVDYKDEVKLKDGDYSLHLWNGKPSAAADNARWEITGR
ncbi:hypothetical protein [Nocardia sp. NPDC055049]